MMERNIKCPKCQRAMQKGYIPDATYGGVVLGTWVEGEVETGFLGAIKLKGKTRRTITAYRCSSCGYLESDVGGTVSMRQNDLTPLDLIAGETRRGLAMWTDDRRLARDCYAEVWTATRIDGFLECDKSLAL